MFTSQVVGDARNLTGRGEQGSRPTSSRQLPPLVFLTAATLLGLIFFYVYWPAGFFFCEGSTSIACFSP